MEKKGHRPGLSSFALHLAAMGLMLCDHLWGTFLGNLAWLGYLGRIAFPLFAFLLVEGFAHTASRKKYALRLLVFALISELPFNLCIEHRLLNPFHQNVLWTFLISLGMLCLFETIRPCRRPLLRILLYGLVTFGGYLLGFVGFVDYFGYGVLMVAVFYFTRMDPGMRPEHRVLLGLVQLGAMYYINCEMMMGLMIPVSVFGMAFSVYKQGFALLALPLIWLYNGSQGVYNKTVKKLYYWFYPVHLLILGLAITFL